MTQIGQPILASVFTGLLVLFPARPAACQAANETLMFEVASVRVKTPARGDPINSFSGGPGTSDPELIVFRGVAFEQLLARAFDIEYDFLLEAPTWMRSQFYDIAAKVPPGATKRQTNQMLLTLLKERFHLKLHHEIRQVKGYEFTVAKGGSKLKESHYPDAPEVAPYSNHVKHVEDSFPQVEPGYRTIATQVYNGRMFVTARSVPVSSLFSFAFNGLGEASMKTPWADKTGLIGKYDADFMFAVQSRSPNADPPGGPSSVEVFEKQLGLRVEKKIIAVDVIVVDSADKIPTEN